MDAYICTPEQITATIEKYGVAIVPNVLDAIEIKEMQDGMFDFLEHVTAKFEKPIDRNNTETFVEFYKLYPNHGMLLQHWQVGHTQFIWNLRQNPKVVDAFAKVWKCAPEDLLCSYDGASFHLSAEITKRGKFRSFWYHTDQSYTRPDFECIQSWVTAYDVNEGDATLAFIEGSHKHHAEFQKTFDVKDKNDWYPVKKEELDFYTKHLGLTEKKITCPAGSLVLWDSRTIHCGVQHGNREKVNFRCVAYICMTPRALATKAALKKHITAFESIRMTSHWPHKPKLFPKNPRTYGAMLPETQELAEPPKLMDLGKRLVGY
jgi:ectoine hydroxylase-related dioxygenase (phytanoyl-CoA dioxygenase family)